MKLDLIKEVEIHKNAILSTEIDNNIVLTGSKDNTVSLRNFSDLSEIARLSGHKSDIKRAFLSLDKEKIVSVSTDTTIKIWSAKDFLLTNTLYGHEGEINYAFFTENGQLLTCGDDKTIRLWNIEKNSPLKTIKLDIGDINAAAPWKNGFLFGGSALLVTDKNFSTIKKDDSYIYGINYIAAKNNLAFISASMEKIVNVFDLNTMSVKAKIKNSSWTNSIAFYENKTILACGEEIKILNEKFETETAFIADTDEVYSISVYENFIVSAGNDKKLKLWKISQ